MSQPFTQYHRETGQISSRESMNPHELHLGENCPEGYNWIDGHYDPKEFYIEEYPAPEYGPPPPPEVVQRPQNEPPTVEDNNVVWWGDIPPESLVWVTNEAGQRLERTAGQGPLQLVDPGVYTLAVEPPFPYHRHAVTVRIE